MSKTIDERVVSMQFDNRNFEANVKTSLSTLDKLKQKLNLTGATKGLENLGAAASKVNFSPLASGLETVSMKFSALEVMAVTALSNITNQAINTGKQLVKSLSIDQLKTGWNKYEQKTASVQTIMNATGKSIDEVSAYLDRLMWYSDETSYGFIDMSQSLAQLTSAGGDVEKLIPMIEGIANATAFAGKGVSEFSRAIFNLNQSYSAGALKLMDWRSLELAGVASKQLKQVFIDTAKEVGTLNDNGETLKGTLVGIGNFSETLQEQWANTEVMEKAFGKFAEVTEAARKMIDNKENEVENATQAYKILSGELNDAEINTYNLSDAEKELIGSFDETAVSAAKAAQEAKTFSEAIEATKDAVSSQWMKTYELIFGNKEEATKIWSELTDGLWEVFASGGERRNEILSDALGSKWKVFTKQINEAGVSTEDFTKKLIDFARKDEEAAKIFNNGVEYNSVGIDKLIEKYGSLEAVLASGELTNGENLIIRTLESFAGAEEKVSGTTDDLTGKLEEFQKVVNGVIRGDFGSGLERMDALAEAGYNYDLVQGLVNKVWERNGQNWSDTTISVEELTEAISQLSDSELESIGYTEDQITTLRQLADEAKKTGTPINNLIKKLQKPSGRELLIDSVRNALIGLKSILDTFKGAWANVFPEKSVDEIYSIIEGIHNFSESLKPSVDTLNKLKRILTGLFSIIGIGVDVAKELGKALLDVLMSDSMSEGTSNVLDLAAGVGDAITNFRVWLRESKRFSKGFSAVGGVVKVVLGFLSKAFSFLPENIGGVYEKFKQSELFGKISEKISSASKTIGDAIDGLLKKIDEFDFAWLNDKVGSIVDFFTGLASAVKENSLVQGIIGGISKAFSSLKNIRLPKFNAETFISQFAKLNEFLSAEGFSGKGFFSTISGSFEWLKQQFNFKMDSSKYSWLLKFSEFFTKNGETIKKGFKTFGEFIKTVATSLFGAIENIDLNRVLDTAKTILEMAVLLEVLRILKNVTGTVESIGDAFSNIAKAKKWDAIASCFKAMAIAIGAFALCLYVISTIEDPKKAWSSLGIVSAIIIVLGGVIAGLTWLASKASGAVGMASVTAVIVGIAVAMLLMVKTLKEIDSLNIKDIGRSIGIMLTMLLSIVGSVILIGKFAGGASVKSAAAIITLLTALKMILGILEDYAEFPWHKVRGAIPKLISMLLGLAVSLRIATSGIKSGASAGGSAMTMIAMVIALKLMLNSVKELGEMDSDKMWQGIKGVITILGGITTMIAVINLTNKGGVLKKGERSINSLKGIAVALLSMVAAIYLFGHMDNSTLLKGGSVVIVVLGLLAGIMKVMSETGAGKFKIGVTLTTIIGIGLIIAELAFVVNQLSKIGLENAVGSASALSILLFSIAYCVGILSKDQSMTSSGMYKWIGAMEVMVFIILELAVVLGVLSYMGVDGGQAIQQVTALSVLLLAMSGVLYICSRIGPAASAAEPALLLFGKAMVALIAFLLLLGDLDILLDGTVSKALDSAVEIMGKVGQAIGDFVGGIVGGVLDGITSIIPKIGEDLSAFAENASGFFNWLKNLDSSILGKAGILAGVIAELTGLAFIEGIIRLMSLGQLSLPALGTDLGTFMTNAQPFFDALPNISEESISGVDRLAGMIKKLSEANLVEAFASIFGSGEDGLTRFSSNLVVFGDGIVDFSNSISSLTETDLTNVDLAAQAGEKLSAMAEKIPKEGGVHGWLFGETKLDKFGKSISIFGECLVDFSGTISSLSDNDIEQISKSADAGMHLSDLANAIPPEGGVAGWLFGENNLATFGSSIVEFAKGLVAYSNEISGFDSGTLDKIAASADAAMHLSDLANDIPKEDGAIAWLFGTNDLATFGESIVVFGDCLKQYVDKIKSFSESDVNAIENSAAATEALVKVANKIPEEGGWWDKVDGERNISAFGLGMVDLADGIKSYCAVANGIDQKDIDAIDFSKKAVSALADVAKEIFGTGGLPGFFKGDVDLSSFGRGLTSLGYGISNYIRSVSEITESDIEKIGTSAEGISKVSDVAKDLPYDSTYVNTFASAMTSLGVRIKEYSDTVKDISQEDVDAITRSGTAIEAIARAANTIPNEGGLAAWLAGENSIEPFTIGMGLLASAIIDYADKVSGLTDEHVSAITRSGSAIEEITNAASSIPNEGGLAAWLNGDNSIEPFTSGMGLLASAIIDYASKVRDLKISDILAISMSGKAIKALTDATSTIPNIYGFDDSVGGQIEQFANGIIKIADTVVSYAKKVSSIGSGDIDAIKNSKKAIDALVKAVKAASGGFDDSFGITRTVNGINQFIDVIERASGVDVSDTNGLSAALTELSKVSIKNLTSEFEKSSTVVSSAASKMIDSIGNSIRKRIPTVTGAISAMVTFIRIKYDEMYMAGNHLGTGLVNGINSKQTDAYNAGYALGQAAVQGEKDGQESNSPSKLTIKSGKWLGEGLVIGIKSFGSQVYDAGYDVGSIAVDSISNSISRIKDIIESDIDSQPTIRPVIDLSDINAGVGAINGLLNLNPSIGAMANVRAISAGMNGGQNGTTNDVISAINDLGRRIGKTSGDTYNINGVTYDDGSNVYNAVRTIVRAARIERRV